VKSIMFGEYGDIICTAVGASDTTYFCDYYYQADGLRAFLFGGGAAYGAHAGFACGHATNAPSYTFAYIGSRLCLYTSAA